MIAFILFFFVLSIAGKKILQKDTTTTTFQKFTSAPPVRLWSPPQRHTPGHTNWAWSVHVSDVQRPTLDNVPGSISDMEGEPLGGQCV